MMKLLKMFGIIVVLLVFSFSMTTCENDENDGDDGFTINDIPSEYNNKFAYFYDQIVFESGNGYQIDHVSGFQSIDYSYTLIRYTVKIVNGSVTIPLWVEKEGSFYKYVKYSGSGKAANGNLCIVDIPVFTGTFPDPIVARRFTGLYSDTRELTFKNGKAIKSWNEGYFP